MIITYKKIITIFLLLLTSSTWAMKAVVISLEAPLFLKKSIHSTIVQRVRKGEFLYISDSEFGTSPNEKDYLSENYFDNEDDLFNLYTRPTDFKNQERAISYMWPNLFYKTLNKNGVTCYIQGKHIKIVYKDMREVIDNTPYPKQDLTDYRLEEPLAKEYPFYSNQRYRLATLFGITPSSSSNYVYGQPANSEQSSRRYTGEVTYLKNIQYDKTNRIYFGGNFSWSLERKVFLFNQNDQAEELKIAMGVGPYFSYDFYRSADYTLSIFGNILVNYDRSFIKTQGAKGIEQRLFTGIYPSLKAGLIYTYNHFFIPNLLFSCGTNFHLHPAYTLSSTDPIIPQNWNLTRDDKVHYPLNGFVNIFMGLSIFY